MARLILCIIIALFSAAHLGAQTSSPSDSRQALRAVFQAMQQRFTQDAELSDEQRLQLATVLWHAFGDPNDARIAIELLVRQAQQLATVAPPRERETTRVVARRVAMLCLVYQHLHEHLDDAQKTIVHQRLVHAAATLAGRDVPVTRGRLHSDETQRYVALALVACLFPNEPQAKEWLDQAISDFRSQMNHAIYPDGSWRSGPVDHALALRAMVQLALTLRQAGDNDLFRESRLAATFEAFIRSQTPRDLAAGGVTLLTDDEGRASSNAPFAILASAAQGFATTNRALAERLIWAWQRAGTPWITAEDDLLHVLLIDPTLNVRAQPTLTSHITDAGIALLRQRVDTPDEMLLAVRLADTGSISLHAAGTPLILHNTAGNHVNVGLPVRRPGKIEYAVFDPEVQFLSVDLSTADRDVIYRRRVLTLDPGIIMLWDNIARGQGAELQLHIVGQEPGLSSQDGIDRLRFTCFNDVTLDWSILQPRDAHTRELMHGQADTFSLRVEVEQHGTIVPAYEATPIRVRLRQARPHEDILSVLTWAARDDEPAIVRGLAAPSNTHALRVTHGGNHWNIHLLSQHTDAIRTTAVAAIVRRNAEQALQRIVMIDGVAVTVPEGYSVTASTATSIALQVLDAGRRYELSHLGDATARLRVTLPWSRPDAVLRVHRIRNVSATLLHPDDDGRSLTFDAEPGDRFILQR